ncbi:similar to Saccharomyces cerevisiae YGR080W TWF1 Twinfilin [Maudiozyma barnettii]|uniref:Similar to Saccharomyces cerevisiae YGR080W TWF1 Twinfilin n=1 Tax=Maudiozyma barnettii TaxID=61262 RepID=A0A8H2ZF35_9SACH|nr:Twf1p [Kazachstania barnettii]CAB4251905.1 similar to Saccharomyces cerevisiae YGR080W TWF1 Twinfilin [Kazachstania barnettii]CAD1778231.1 similar to Saccharomyces cerevisiae YGR080W TWF1 Twinfilin [Kazachstania barnettii]
MSNQSGICANEELLNVIRSTPNNGLLIIAAKISSDSTAVEFKEKFDTTNDLLESLDSDPSYILIKDSKKNPEVYDFISFVPDPAPVRAKMIYASTKNTLLRQIGSNVINSQMMFSEPQEITDFVNSSTTTSSQSTLLSESEKIGIQINEEQRNMRALQGHQLVSQNNGTPNSLTFEVNSSAGSIKSLLESNNVITFKINMDNEKVEVTSQTNITSSDAISLTSEHPSYTIFKNGELYYFIYSCPSGSKVKERMLYASNKQGFINHLKDNEGISFTKILEIGDADELEKSLMSSSTEAELKQKEESSKSDNNTQRFNRPKGPTRRKRI